MIKTPDATFEKGNQARNHRGDSDLPVSKTKQIRIDEEPIEDETVTVSFQDEELASHFATKQTKVSKDDGDLIDPKTSVEDLQKQISDHEESKSGKMDYDSLKQTATLLINIMDTGLATFFNWFGQDKGLKDYALPATNKKLLIEQLTLVLAKYQSKFKIEFVFFMALIVMWSPMAVSAVQSRKENKIKGKSGSTTTNKTETTNKQIIDETKTHQNADTSDKSTINEKDLNLPMKRPQGRPKKVAK